MPCVVVNSCLGAARVGSPFERTSRGHKAEDPGQVVFPKFRRNPKRLKGRFFRFSSIDPANFSGLPQELPPADPLPP